METHTNREVYNRLISNIPSVYKVRDFSHLTYLDEDEYTPLEAIYWAITQLMKEFLDQRDEIFEQVYKTLSITTYLYDLIGSVPEYEEAFNLSVDSSGDYYDTLRIKRIQRRLKNKKRYTLKNVEELIESYGIPCSLSMGTQSSDYYMLYITCSPESVEGNKELSLLLDNIVPMNINFSLTSSHNVNTYLSTELVVARTIQPYVLDGSYTFGMNLAFYSTTTNTFYNGAESSNLNTTAVASKIASSSYIEAGVNDDWVDLNPPTKSSSGNVVTYLVTIPASTVPVLEYLCIYYQDADVDSYLFYLDYHLEHSIDYSMSVAEKITARSVVGYRDWAYSKVVNPAKVTCTVGGTDTDYALSWDTTNGYWETTNELTTGVYTKFVIKDSNDTVLDTLSSKTLTLGSGETAKLRWYVTWGE